MPERPIRPEFTQKPEFMCLAAAQKRNSPSLFIELMIFLLVYVVCVVAELLLSMIPILIWLLTSGSLNTITETVLQGGSIEAATAALLGSLPAWIYAAVRMLAVSAGVCALLYCLLFEKRRPVTMGLVRKHALRHTLLGLLLGLVLSAGVFGLALLFRGVRVTGLALRTESLPLLLLCLLAYLLEGFGEGMLFHGYLTVSLSKQNRLIASVLASAAAYSAIMGGSGGSALVSYLNAGLLALFAGLLMLRTGSLWSLFGLYGVWHFCQSGLLLDTGTQVEGMPGVFFGSVIGHSELLTGGDAGLGASLCATFVLLAGVGVLVAVLLRRPPEPAEEMPAD